ncbi:metalloendopeptidase-like membrane protein [Desulfosporosinus orientis DSM 765]|uniref:Metalloendopeptidase-like membrane protein n=1 Tax=Desulfosporosinus orientis (strain ATCC 19365 / DSM 765 / NCIMB 8382 / VKM B-1628 / Singapore I) TaxID=768706 RepID=G7WHG7_DESOD|nr:M23 family metallopeptidase [Desulfosporosinus orientis]AET70888.1 metalloendopeptidase-like membrane protein [Desulfosporosinus orientis DSM 765]
MRRWRISKEWYVVWGFTLFIGGLILYVGYLSANYNIAIEKPQSKATEAVQAVTTVPSQPQDTVKDKQKIDSKEQIISNDSQENLELKDFPSPVHGEPIRSIGNYYSEAYDDYIFHAGLDYALKDGTVIRANHGGKVIFAGEDPILGCKVTIDCGDGWIVTYGGLDNLRIKKGEVIEEQTALGQIGYFPGGEGESNQPQLHYEVWHNGEVQYVEP